MRNKKSIFLQAWQVDHHRRKSSPLFVKDHRTGEGRGDRKGTIEDRRGSEARLLLLLDGSHGSGGGGMTLLGSAQHQRLIDPLQ
jgi:hypothetical protein